MILYFNNGYVATIEKIAELQNAEGSDVSTWRIEIIYFNEIPKSQAKYKRYEITGGWLKEEDCEVIAKKFVFPEENHKTIQGSDTKELKYDIITNRVEQKKAEFMETHSQSDELKRIIGDALKVSKSIQLVEA